MLNPIDTSKYTQAALRKLAHLPPKRLFLGAGRIAAINLPSDTPFIVEMESGALFKLGGLNKGQASQLPSLHQQLIGQRIAFKFQGGFNDLNQPINPIFNTLLLAANTGGVQ